MPGSNPEAPLPESVPAGTATAEYPGEGRLVRLARPPALFEAIAPAIEGLRPRPEMFPPATFVLRDLPVAPLAILPARGLCFRSATP